MSYVICVVLANTREEKWEKFLSELQGGFTGGSHTQVHLGEGNLTFACIWREQCESIVQVTGCSLLMTLNAFSAFKQFKSEACTHLELCYPSPSSFETIIPKT
jgi:hypothetical protein